MALQTASMVRFTALRSQRLSFKNCSIELLPVLMDGWLS
jgi:hypothetical protein